MDGVGGVGGWLWPDADGPMGSRRDEWRREWEGGTIDAAKWPPVFLLYFKRRRTDASDAAQSALDVDPIRIRNGFYAGVVAVCLSIHSCVVCFVFSFRRQRRARDVGGVDEHPSVGCVVLSVAASGGGGSSR